ncbi:hypothetical protein IMY05_009G0112100 [Salix suchowensis]|nr:hypothetical protein IMY05_009G0112100 [Salix suchowensis]
MAQLNTRSIRFEGIASELTAGRKELLSGAAFGKFRKSVAVIEPTEPNSSSLLMSAFLCSHISHLGATKFWLKIGFE